MQPGFVHALSSPSAVFVFFNFANWIPGDRTAAMSVWETLRQRQSGAGGRTARLVCSLHSSEFSGFSLFGNSCLFVSLGPFLPCRDSSPKWLPVGRRSPSPLRKQTHNAPRTMRLCTVQDQGNVPEEGPRVGVQFSFLTSTSRNADTLPQGQRDPQRPLDDPGVGPY